jgi:SAM-dependent methyltransferase
MDWTSMRRNLAQHPSFPVRLLYKLPCAIKNFVVGFLKAKLKKHQCNICGYRKVAFTHATWFQYFLRCPMCDTYFSSNLPDASKIYQEFSISDDEEYWLKRSRYVISDKDCEKDWEGWVDWKNKTFNRLHLEEFEKALGEPRKALEIGCAEGKVLEILKSRQWKVVGLDISEYEARHSKKLGFHVIVAAADKINFRDECFDLAVMFHTLEHTIDPALVIKNIFTILKKGGRLILEVPCVDSRKSFFVDCKSISHHYFFSEKGLEKMLKSNGFTYLDKFIYEDKIHRPKRNICCLVEKR